jgi:fumarate hydratase subunit beta
VSEGAPRILSTPLSIDDVESLQAGDRVLLGGTIYTGRDAAHHRLDRLIRNGEPLPFDPEGQVIYYVGPSPPKPGWAVGSAGPTTSYRMDPYTPGLLAQGLRGMIGKGPRSPAVKEAMKKYRAVYFAAVGGAGALLAQRIRSAAVIAYPELGPEAVYRFEVQDFPLIVAIDCSGTDLYEEGVRQYRLGE